VPWPTKWADARKRATSAFQSVPHANSQAAPVQDGVEHVRAAVRGLSKIWGFGCRALKAFCKAGRRSIRRIVRWSRIGSAVCCDGAAVLRRP
jgi:hypothetical protein